ncbi:hypothetical protein [Paludisphaera rhizosphaerae]|uniref:hypothetical protein n=1 Tax=Paludisphaera rhizosphaerae TaxID=2711216 RepID=UPI0013E9AEE9|nr:hypothetical protein [Paludisphaera rhizosphaerae]
MSALEDGTDADRIRDAVTLAKNMRNNGVSRETIAIRLANRGFKPQAVEEVLRQVPREEPVNIIVGNGSTNGGRMILVAVGAMISLMGLFFVVGNRTGAAPTVPFFGFTFMVIGGVIMNAGRS